MKTFCYLVGVYILFYHPPLLFPIYFYTAPPFVFFCLSYAHIPPPICFVNMRKNKGDLTYSGFSRVVTLVLCPHPQIAFGPGFGFHEYDLRILFPPFPSPCVCVLPGGCRSSNGLPVTPGQIFSFPPKFWLVMVLPPPLSEGVPFFSVQLEAVT